MTRTDTIAGDRRTARPVLTSRRARLTVLVGLLVVFSALFALGQIARADQHAKPAPPSARAAAHALLDRFNGRRVDRARYDWARSCTHGAQRGTIALQRFMKHFAPRGESMGIFSCRMTRGGSNYSLHAEGRALDWHLSIHNRADREQAQRIITMLLGSDSKGRKAALARRIGVQELIWDCRIFSVRSMHWKRSGLCPPGRRVSDTIAHRDHVHVGLNWLGARKRTSFWRQQR
jgi:hypothetical protein